MALKLNNGTALGIVSAFTLLVLSGCGGGSDAPLPPVVPTPPDAPRAWSTPQLSAISFSLASVTAHADACGGVSVLGINGANWVAQRFTPKGGWQAPQTLVPSNAGNFQRLDVGGVPQIFYRDATNWVRGAFDCASNTWNLSVAFPVVYVPFDLPESSLYAVPVTVSETFERTMLAASFLPASALQNSGEFSLREFRDGAWTAATITRAFDSASTGSSPITNVYNLFVVRTRDGDAASIAGMLRSFATFRAKNATDFVAIAARGCLGHFCVGYAFYDSPRLELDGTATTVFKDYWGLAKPDWFRISATGLQSLLTNSTAWLAQSENDRLVRPDGVAQWIAAEQNSSSAVIYEGSVTATWTNLASFENAACHLAGCRAFSSPETGHVATLLNPSDTPVRAPQIAISDRTGSNRWEGSFTRSLGDVWAAGPNATSAGNGTMQLITYRATASSEIVVATLTSTRLTGETDVTPFALWK